MSIGINLILLITTTTILLLRVNSVSAVCDLSFVDRNKLYNFSLASPLSNFPHGILSEDGFYKVTANETVVWFQLCYGMIFNHGQPQCVGCSDCGGPSLCGMGCSALVVNDIGGYQVCTTLGRLSNTFVDVVDKENPHKGVIIKMSNNNPKLNCSLSVSVLCDSKGLREPQNLEKLGDCNYATELWHPSGCATIISVHGRGFRWFGTFLIIMLCGFGGYLLAGAVYRFFVLGVHGIDAIPNLELWASIPQRSQRWYGLLVQKFRGPSHGHRSTYSRVNF